MNHSRAAGFTVSADWGAVAFVTASVWSGDWAVTLGVTVSWVLGALVVWALELVGFVLRAVVALGLAFFNRVSASVIEALEFASWAHVGDVALAE